MNIKVKTPSAAGAITIEEAKKHLTLDSTYTDEDDNIQSDILSLTKELDERTGKKTMTQTLELFFDSWEELEEHKIKQGKIKEVTSLEYLDKSRVSNPVTDFVLIGEGTDFGRIVFNDSFIKPEIWGIESIILTIVVGEDTAPEDKKLTIKVMLSELYEDRKSEAVDRYVRNNKYR